MVHPMQSKRFLLITIQAIVFALVLTALYGKLKHDRYYKTIELVQNTQIKLSVSMLGLAKDGPANQNKLMAADFSAAFKPIAPHTPIRVYRSGELIFQQKGSRNPVLTENYKTHEIGDLKFIFGIHDAPPWFVDPNALLGIGSGAKFWKWVLDPKNWFSGRYDYIHVPFLFFLVIFFTFRYGHIKLLGLGKHVERQKVEKLEFCITTGETKTIEFKQSLSLDTIKKTKEKYIEDAVLKTICAFMNSDGGTLLVGVADDGSPTGVADEIQKFHKSNDKFLLHFKNLVSNKIGAEIYPLLEYELREFRGAQLLMVSCQKSSKEVFMNGAEFYVRTNPATDRLEGKKLLDYCKTRFNKNS
ncbi:ATP-binding protein [Alphaproteobacteria bacterium]|nr:ATP-binding protein [Alphaproteobacteria bacterium]